MRVRTARPVEEVGSVGKKAMNPVHFAFNGETASKRIVPVECIDAIDKVGRRTWWRWEKSCSCLGFRG